MIESLESRRMFSVTVVKTGAFLYVNGNNANDNIVVVERDGNVEVSYTDASKVYHDGTNHLDPKAYFTGIDAIKINGGAGNDSIYYTGNSRGADIHGDAIIPPAPTNLCELLTQAIAYLRGDYCQGNDNISISDEGIAGSTVRGDGGNDALVVVHSHDSFVYGGNGNDQIHLNARDVSESVNVFAEAGKDVITTYGGTNYIDGGDGKDTLLNFGGANSFTSIEVVA